LASYLRGLSVLNAARTAVRVALFSAGLLDGVEKAGLQQDGDMLP
jgi:hypothetical protein